MRIGEPLTAGSTDGRAAIECRDFSFSIGLPRLTDAAAGERRTIDRPASLLRVDGCHLESSGSTVAMTVSEAVGGPLDYPELVTPDFVREAAVQIRIRSNGRGLWAGEECGGFALDQELVFRVRLEAADVEALDDPATCRLE